MNYSKNGKQPFQVPLMVSHRFSGKTKMWSFTVIRRSNTIFIRNNISLKGKLSLSSGDQNSHVNESTDWAIPSQTLNN
jgi:hypothetical protein